MIDKPEIIFVGSGPGWYADRFAEHFTLHKLPNGDASELDPEVRGRVEALVSAAPITRSLIEAFPKLRMIANPGVGYEKIDIGAALEKGVIVTNTPGTTDGCVADLALGLLLAATREILKGDRFVRKGAWLQDAYPLVPRVHGKRLGILGLGEIGMAIAKRAEAFDMAVSYHNRRRRKDVRYTYFETVEELAEASDILMIACPGGDGTRHLVNREVLAALGPDGFVVNISRGTVIDEAALISALQEGTIAGAGLDVFENEPVVPEALIALENVVLMPHRGGGTTETWIAAADLTIANLNAHFRNENVLTPIA